jgi:hypothetical protein
MATGEREHDTLVLDASGDTEGHAIYSKLNVISLPQIVIVIYTQLLLTENAISTLDDFPYRETTLTSLVELSSSPSIGKVSEDIHQRQLRIGERQRNTTTETKIGKKILL